MGLALVSAASGYLIGGTGVAILIGCVGLILMVVAHVRSDKFADPPSLANALHAALSSADTAERSRDGESWMDLYEEKKRLEQEIAELEGPPPALDFFAPTTRVEIRPMTGAELRKSAKIHRLRKDLALINDRLKRHLP